MLSLISLPDPAQIIATTTTWSAPLFNDLIYVVVAMAGFMVAALFLRRFGRLLLGAVKSALGGKRGGRRRRR